MKDLKGLEEKLFERAAEAHFILKDGVVVKSNRQARRIFHTEDTEWLNFDPFHPETGLFKYLPDEESLLKTKLKKAGVFRFGFGLKIALSLWLWATKMLFCFGFGAKIGFG